jgi:hypothetical protein
VVVVVAALQVGMEVMVVVGALIAQQQLHHPLSQTQVRGMYPSHKNL